MPKLLVSSLTKTPAGLVRFFGTGTDFHKKLAALRDEIRLEKGKAEAILDLIGDGVVTIDREGRVLSLNPVAQQLTGWRSEDALGNPLSCVFLPVDNAHDRSPIDCSVERCICEKTASVPLHALVISRSGETFLVDYSVSPIIDSAGASVGAVVVLRDATERLRTEGQLHARTRYAHSLIESSLDPTLVVDPHGKIIDLNQAAEQAIGLAQDGLVGRYFADCFVQGERALKMLRQVFADEFVRDCYLSLLHRGGRAMEVVCNARVYCNDLGDVECAFIVARDITDLRLYESQMLFQASYDALTALPNRTWFIDHLNREIESARLFGSSLGVMLIDLDNFKNVNDALGHSVGDDVLKMLTNRLQNCLRDNDTLARLGGDEFVVLAGDVGYVQDVELLAARLLKVVAEPLNIEGLEVVVNCSIGITIFPADDSDAEGMLRNADTAMKRAKEGGRDSYRHFTVEMDASLRRRVEIGNRLQRAVHACESEFMLHFQPQVELASGAIVGVEALVRWNAEGIGMVSPGEFIPVAEQNGTIVQIGEWVLRNACRQAVRWQEEQGVEVSMAVNLSARQFRVGDIVQSVSRVLEETGLAPELLELELTESMLMHDIKGTQRTLHDLKRLGIRLAVDDFGTGYSSLSYLKDFPLDYLKVDRSFVIALANGSGNMAIVRTIIGMAHTLGMKVIAEGVETYSQLEFLLGQDCDEIQGYYFSKPVPSEGILAMLREGRGLDSMLL